MSQRKLIENKNAQFYLMAAIIIIAIIIGFVPPTQILINNTLFFEIFLISGLIIFTILPLLLINK